MVKSSGREIMRRIVARLPDLFDGVTSKKYLIGAERKIKEGLYRLKASVRVSEGIYSEFMQKIDADARRIRQRIERYDGSLKRVFEARLKSIEGERSDYWASSIFGG
jgi:hypothetical protein